MTTATQDRKWMAMALRLAERGLCTTDPNPRVGCILVKEGEIVGQGWHRWAGGPHAEIEALNLAGNQARGADCYVTLEPCCHFGRTPPCTEALIKAGVRRVVAAMVDPNAKVAGQGLRQLRRAGIEVTTDILAEQSEQLNKGFCKRMRSGRPWVTSKLAASLDGRTAVASGESRWITSLASRRDVHRLRARSSAILTGIGTVLADDPSLTARVDEPADIQQPLRVVVDSSLRMPVTAKMLSLPGQTLIATVCEDRPRRQALERQGAQVLVMASDDHGRVDLAALMMALGRREINEILVEAGAVLNGALLGQDLIDDWVLYLAPTVLGDDALGMFRLPQIKAMADRIPLHFQEIRQIGPDLKIQFRKG